MDFDWNQSKAASNLQKHKIDFIDAVTIFNDPAHQIAEVTKPEHGEQRWKAFGMMYDGRMATVIYTDRGQYRRIISARKIRKNEQREYDKGKTTS